MPPADEGLRRQLDAEAAERGWPALHAELVRVDPTTAARLAPADSQRIQRALEVQRLTGRPLSDWHRRTPRAEADAARNLPLLSLEPTSRAWLHERIAQRFDAMLAQGLVDEVRTLRTRGDLHAGLPSMRCVGYRQAWQALDRGDLSALRDTGIAATRQLAKRQLTWLRSITPKTVVPCDAGDALQQSLQVLQGLADGRAA
jgi:tRNA dimethylallyltransferase